MPPKAAPRRGAATTTSSSTRPSQQQQQQQQPAAADATASSGARQPVQRLQSLKKRAPTGSITPAAGSARPSVTPGPNAGPGGEPSKPTLKYKPRAVGRRSKEEREAIEKVEAERHQERLREAAAIQRGRGGRGGPAGRGGRGRGGGPGGSAAGPLGDARGGLGGARRGRAGRFVPGDSRATSMSGRSRTRSVIDMGSGAAGTASRDVSSDESDSGLLVDIDQINLDSDEEGVDDFSSKSKGKGKMTAAAAAQAEAEMDGEKSLRPIRVERHEHEERVVSVNMESSSSKSAELREQAKKAKAKEDDDDALFVPLEEAATSTDEPRVKEEPTEDGDQVMQDVPAAEEADDELLPAQKVKVRRKISKESTPAAAAAAPKEPKSLLRTKEDIEEYERHEKDLGVIKDLLYVEPKEPTAAKGKEPRAQQPDVKESEREKPETGTAEDEENREKPAEEEELDSGKLSGQLFLIQFPPMTPNLVVPGEAQAPATEPEAAAAAAAEPQPQPEEPSVKRDPDDPEILNTNTTNAYEHQHPKLVTAAGQHLPAGHVGQLNVHASGKVTINWGGINFELDKATDVDFLQEALVLSSAGGGATEVDEDGVKKEIEQEDEMEEEKRVWAMGQLSGKFTVTPDWEKIL